MRIDQLGQVEMNRLYIKSQVFVSHSAEEQNLRCKAMKSVVNDQITFSYCSRQKMVEWFAILRQKWTPIYVVASAGTFSESYSSSHTKRTINVSDQHLNQKLVWNALLFHECSASEIKIWWENQTARKVFMSHW